MLIKIIGLHSLTYLVGITSSIAAQQVISYESLVRFQSGIGHAAIFTKPVAVKSDRLPLKQAKPQVNDKAPTQAPAQIAPSLKFKTDCKPPIDVLGRCFAEGKVNYNVG
jgi:hypothetical protein